VYKLLLSFLLLPLTFVLADSIELRDGTKIEGKILSISPESVVMEVRPTSTIVEEKTYARSEVDRINRTSADDLAFERLSQAGLPSTADSPEVYEALLESQVRPFMKNFAYSKHMPAVRQLAARLEEELARARGGEVKIDGEWIPAGSGTETDPEVRGRLHLAKMKQAAQPAAALAAFEVLEKESRNTSAYPEAIRLARTRLAEMQTLVTRMRADTERRERELSEGLQLASIDRRQIMQQGIDQERAALKTRIEAAKKSGGKWHEPVPDPAYLLEMEKTIRQEEDRLGKIDPSTMDAAVAAAQTARQQAEAGDFAKASANLDEAQKLWPQYVLLASLKESLRKAQEEAARRAKEEEKSSGS
jgi:hypothetical protein